MAAVLEPGLIRTVVALCPHNGWPHRASTFDELAHGVPVLIVSGTCDPLACPCFHGRRMYDATTDDTPKLYLEVTGGHEVTHGPSGGSTWSWLGPFGCYQATFGIACPCLCCNCCADDCGTGRTGPPEEGCCSIYGKEVMGQYAMGWLRIYLQDQRQFLPLVNLEPQSSNEFQCSTDM